MLSREDNERLVRVGPGTPMGTTMRRYWHPVARHEELAKADGKPLRIELLGERFVLFRDSAGQVGMLEELCMHRGASLAIGRVEDGGIRCLYHGWKFAVDGTILETPNHADCRLRERKKAAAFPVREAGGLIWAYIGPAENEPPFRSFACDDAIDAQRLTIRINIHVNYLQLWEGGLDSSHVSILHTNQARPTWSAERGADKVTAAFQPLDDCAPTFEIEDTPFGYHYAAIRSLDAAGSQRNVRVVPAILPTGRIIPGPGIDFLVWETPANDEWTNTFITIWSRGETLDKQWVLAMLGLDDPRFWSESDPVYKGTWANDFFQDRDGMGANWTGLRGIEVEDATIGLSYGPIFDRSKENLVPADLAVVRIRRRLMDCIRLVESGEPPIGVMLADMREVSAPDEVVGPDTNWRDIAAKHRMVGQLEAAE